MYWWSVARGVVSDISKGLQSFKTFDPWRWRRPRCFKTWEGGGRYSTTKCQIPELLSYQHVEVIWKVPKTICRHERDEVTGGGKKMHAAKVFGLYLWLHIVRVIRLASLWYARLLAHLVHTLNVYRALLGVPGGKLPCGRSYRSWKYPDRDAT